MRLIQIHLLSTTGANKFGYPARCTLSSFKMSGQRISQTSSDFSIARILSTSHPKRKLELSPASENKYRRQSEKIIPDTKKQDEEDEESKRSERLQSASVDEEKDQKFGLLKRQLPWLQCTRYSPPKLPRRPATGKQRKRRLGSHPRIPFTKFQIQVLEEKYKINAYLSRRDVIQLGGILNLPQNRVKIWFQNRRARERKESQSNNIDTKMLNL